MAKKIKITCGSVILAAELNDTATARAVADALPITGSVNRWGEEVYFDIPVKMKLEAGARADVEIGEIGYWPTGSAFCVFFGPTPMSKSDQPRAASPVNIIGNVTGDAKKLSSTRDGEKIVISADE
jgi:hypothetical protein